MTAPDKILHFTLGPVQGFIADARRTRDLWAGSFLLSWLSGHAMAALEKAGGKIIFPEVEGDDLFKAITGKGGEPYIGSLPNRFKADISGVIFPAGTNNAGELCKKAIEGKWEELEKAVYDQFIAGVANGTTKEIWARQVKDFWEMNWVIGDEIKGEDNGNWLDQRKNWRTHLQADEGGDLCRLMGRYQEISGFPRIGGKDGQKKFWTALAGKTSVLNLRPDERLCAIALIKRLFPVLDEVENVIGWKPGGDKLNIINWPSVSYIAAVPWLKAVEKLPGKQQSEYWKSAEDNVSVDFMGEAHTKLFHLPKNGLFKLDGHLLHKDGVQAWNADDLEKGEESRKKLLIGLETIEEKVGAYPSEFYAILIMDGDRIGAKIGAHESVVKNGLAKFTKAVKDYFDPNGPDKNPANGVLIYAGGDDVLAFVPVDTAIEAARILRVKYDEAFAAAGAGNTGEDFTMSAAIIFAQYKIPLRAVLKKAHHYIDNIAKEKNGRDSLAIAVMKPGGIAYDWVSCWTRNPVWTIEDIAKDPSQYSSSFFYNIRERYAPLFEGDDPQADRDVEPAFADAGLMEAVLVAEYKKQPGNSKLSFEQAKAAILPLLTIGLPLHRKTGKPEKSKDYNFDGALVARFMSIEGRWHLNKKNKGDDDG